MVLDWLILHVYSFMKSAWDYVFGTNVPRIRQVEIVYVRDGEQETDDVTLEYILGGASEVLKDTSKDVTDVFFDIRYTYKSNMYAYLTRDPRHQFPPPKPTMSFRVPVKEAFLLDAKGVPMHCVTKEIKMYEGPYHDFHGETLRLNELEISEPDCPVIRLVSVTGVTTEFSVHDDSISHQTIWLPSKTLALQDWQHCTLERETDSPPPA